MSVPDQGYWINILVGAFLSANFHIVVACLFIVLLFQGAYFSFVQQGIIRILSILLLNNALNIVILQFDFCNKTKIEMLEAAN